MQIYRQWSFQTGIDKYKFRRYSYGTLSLLETDGTSVVLRGDCTERYCRNGEEIGDQYTCTYGCPVNKDGQGICSKTMLLLFPVMEAVRSGDLEKSAVAANIVRTSYDLTAACCSG